MERFTCDICGYNFEMETDVNILPCPVCKGKCITEEAMKEKEEIARLTDEDTKDDDLTPKQDAEEAITEFLILSMQKNLQEVGNLRTYQFIEDIPEAGKRAKHRKFFLLAGGYIPLCEPLVIK